MISDLIVNGAGNEATQLLRKMINARTLGLQFSPSIQITPGVSLIKVGPRINAQLRAFVQSTDKISKVPKSIESSLGNLPTLLGVFFQIEHVEIKLIKISLKYSHLK